MSTINILEPAMPAGITIVGLGPGDSHHWTLAAQRALLQANEVYVRSAQHPAIPAISTPVYTLDQKYLRAAEIAHEIVQLGHRDQGVLYAVPGNPVVDDASVPLIRTLAAEDRLPVSIIPGLSILDAVFTALKLESLQGIQIIEADQLAGWYHPPLEPDRPVVITRVNTEIDIARLEHTLRNAYPDDFEITIIQNPGTALEHLWRCQLSSLSTQRPLKSTTTLYLPADSHDGFSVFQATIAHLRAPDGCPWDQEQTHQSLRPFLLEETYEVLDALDSNNASALAEELGDLLLQIVLHTQVATDRGEFKMRDVIAHINRKLLRRHPHVFGDVVVNGVDDVTTNWTAIKKAEKAAKKQSGSREQATSVLDGIPPALPALAQALAVSDRAVRVGFEWPNIAGVLEKVVEEAREITEATDPDHLESEIGDLLFSVVNLARWLNIDPESALRATNARFGRRFRQLEALAAAQGKTLPEMSIHEMDVLWNEIKVMSRREEGNENE
jgi:tetrapyrrole methylase family protein/MazG family protein